MKAREEFERALATSGYTPRQILRVRLAQASRAAATRWPMLPHRKEAREPRSGHVRSASASDCAQRARRRLPRPGRAGRGRRREASSAGAPRLLVGLDVGSTTVKAVVVDPARDEVLWRDYQRHDTKQPEMVLEFLTRIEAELRPRRPSAFGIFVTGSGGAAALARHLGGKFVQEVNAVSPGGGEALPRGRLGGRAGRAGREDHRLQGADRERPARRRSLR